MRGLSPSLAINASGRQKVCNVLGPGKSPCPRGGLDDLNKKCSGGVHVVEDACITVAPDGPGSEEGEGGETFPQGRRNPPGGVSPPLNEAIVADRRW